MTVPLTGLIVGTVFTKVPPHPHWRSRFKRQVNPLEGVGVLRYRRLRLIHGSQRGSSLPSEVSWLFLACPSRTAPMMHYLYTTAHIV
ncbi:hypothetical protein WN55_10004 [Dufourea novaeangliae]|uniref:Uncharacterized protein n=1 Tax=Dufourea novaeangliae TaxID=178035 RepID=A0A154P8F3_DUFNO|nr:hypothetical protein WN55_10004 [Dufourea novaeangliae]